MSQQLTDQIIQESVSTVVDHAVTKTCNAYALKHLFETGSVNMNDYNAMKSTATALLTEGAMDFVPEDVNVEVPVGVEAPAEAPVEAAMEDLSNDDIEGIILPVSGTNQLMEIVNGELVPYSEEGGDAPAGNETAPVEESTVAADEAQTTVTESSTAAIATAAVVGNTEAITESTDANGAETSNEEAPMEQLTESEVPNEETLMESEVVPGESDDNSEQPVESLNENATYTDSKASSIVANLLADQDW